ncbi:MAG: flagellar assembly protein FliH [Synergistaceae bacterium]|nr:flagellar assembly protein FliH [Synergistaceae bacterium]
MSKLPRPNVLRAVRLLPEAVRIGSALPPETPPEGEPPRENPRARQDDLMTQLTEELSLLKSRLEETEAENRELTSRSGALEKELAAEKTRVEEERKKLVSEMEAASAAARKKAAGEGFEEGRKAGHDQGLDDARKEASREAADAIRSAVELLESVKVALDKKMDDLVALQSPKLIRMWEHLLSRMLFKEAALDPETALRVLRGTLERINDKERLLVYMNPSDAESVKNRRDEYGDLLRGVRHLEFTPDPNVDAGSCIVETNMGIYDARWRTQLEQIAGEIEQLFLEGGAEDDGEL